MRPELAKNSNDSEAAPRPDCKYSGFRFYLWMAEVLNAQSCKTRGKENAPGATKALSALLKTEVTQ